MLSIVWLCLPASAAAHPQDGPHADLKFIIDENRVRFVANLNLAFLDEIRPLPREVLAEVSDDERDALLAAVEGFYRDDVVVEINGQPVSPRLVSALMPTEYDPQMVGLFPRSGARGLIRSEFTLDYLTDEPPESVAIEWPAYPIDGLALQTESADAAADSTPKMVFEGRLQADGRVFIARFSEAEPRVEWNADGSGSFGQLVDVPVPPKPQPPIALPIVSVLAAAVGIVALVSAAFVGLGKKRMPFAAIMLVIVSGIVGVVGLGSARVAVPGTGEVIPAINQEDAQRVFNALHQNLYRSFDYTTESDIYDALAASVHGPLLDTVYEQVFASLRQAEQDGLIGFVTGVEPIETSLVADSVAGQPEIDGIGEVYGFNLKHRWRVDGTVYHWGHSHTRTHEYEAIYTVGVIGGEWRILVQDLISQQRLGVEPSEAALPALPQGEL